MPVYERKFFLTTFISENEKKQARLEEQSNNATTSGNGKRTTKVSGDQLKSKMKNGEIPNQ